MLRSELGLIFLLFMIGLELNVEELVHLGQAGCNLLPSFINPWWLQQKSGISLMSPATSKNGDSISKHGDVIYVIPIGWLVACAPFDKT